MWPKINYVFGARPLIGWHAKHADKNSNNKIGDYKNRPGKYLTKGRINTEASSHFVNESA